MRQRTEYPWSGSVSIEVEAEPEVELSLEFRIPSWCDSFSCAVNGQPLPNRVLMSGYLEVSRRWKTGDRLELELQMRPKLLRADPRIPELAGKLAVQRGALVYCAEELDNGPDLHLLAFDPEGELEAEADPALMGGSVRVIARGFREGLVDMVKEGEAPYRELGRSERNRRSARVVLVPYHQWGNRKPGGEMAVWLREDSRGRD